MANEEVYLRAILATVARQTYPPDTLARLVSPVRKAGDKQLAAYNLCDGTRSQTDIAKELKLDSGAFSRTVSRWIELGIVVRVGQNRDLRLVHLYPLPVSIRKERSHDRPDERANQEDGHTDPTE